MKWIYNLDGNIQGVFTTLELAAADTDKLGVIEQVTQAELEIKQRAWRDKELKSTDWIIPITDHPERDSYLTYRTNLRNWPSTDDFPATRPTL